jgi:hypothetical protein
MKICKMSGDPSVMNSIYTFIGGVGPEGYTNSRESGM